MVDVQPVSAPPAVGTPADSDDPFLRLHKMSVTAGLGSGDYVAINAFAIAAVLLGVASALVLFHVRLLMIVPVLGVVCGVMAFVQVGRSNGTQAGRGLALLGVALSLGLGGYEGSQWATTGLAERADRDQVIGLIRSEGQDILDEKYQDAYNKYGSELRGYVPMANFEAIWKQVRVSPTFGKMTGLDWNNLLSFDTDPLTGERIAGGMVLLKFATSGEPVRTDMFFRKVDNKTWVIDRFPQFFPKPGDQQQQQNAPAGPKGPRPSNGKPQVFGPPRPS